MAKLTYKLIPSSFTKLLGKYTAVVNSAGSLDADRLASDVSEGRSTIEAADVKLALRAISATIRRNIRELYSVSTSLGTFSPNISGSVPSMDSALDYDVNKFEISVTEPVALNRFVAQIQPSTDGEKPGGITLDNVEDGTSHKIGVIKASSAFLITGRNISGSETGESVEIVRLDGGIAAACTVDSSVHNGQVVKATFTTALEPGVYQVRLATKGFHTPLETAIALTKKVQVSD